MSKLNIARTRDLLQKFDFKSLFIDELGWSQPADRKAIKWTQDDIELERRQIAQLSGVVVFEITASNGQIPNAKTRAAVHKEISQLHHENLLIFLDDQRTQSLWYWVKREDKKLHPRDHLFVKGQPGDLFLSKLSAMVVDISELDETGNLPVVEVANRLKNALDIERVTKRFYKEFYEQHIAFLDLIEGISDDRHRRWYASVLLNRLMFIYFLQKKGFVDNGNQNYLQDKLRESQSKLGRNQYYRNFLTALFFEGFAKPEEERSDAARKLLGRITYLNGGLFLPHSIELNNPKISVPDEAFSNLFGLFERYSWNLNDMPGGDDNEINPDVLGYIFEKYINQKAFGAYYTRTEITEYLCEQTIHKLIVDRVNSLSLPPKQRPEQEKLFGSDQAGLFTSRRFNSMADILLHLDAPLCRLLIREILPNLSILDPPCGSGAFLVAAMKTLVNIYAAVIGHIQVSHDRNLTEWLRRELQAHRSIAYYIKKRIITDNLYGVDVMEEATEIAKLRLFLALVAAAQSVDELEPLPNIDFNILAGNSLIGLMHVDDEDFERRHSQGNLFRKTYRQILDEKNRLIKNYRYTATYADDLRALRDKIEQNRVDALETLNEILLDEFKKLNIKFEEATWDAAKNKGGKPKKHPLKISDIEVLHPFHWGYEFDEILNERGGFDAIITNPPWEIFKPQSKEFFAEYSDIVTKNKMTIKEFEKEQAKLLKDIEVRNAWLEYQSRFPHVSLYFRNVSQYKNQAAVVNGKKVGTDLNLYKLFIEQSFNLLSPKGGCGIITQSGIYTDLGAKQLRELLFSQAELDTLFGLTNEKFVFEGVHHAQKFCILVFRKEGRTESFKAAFRVNPREAIAPDDLGAFLYSSNEHLHISVPLIRRLSPNSLSVMEFKNETDIQIAEIMFQFPLLGEKIVNRWNLVLTNEFHMTGDSGLFQAQFKPGRLPLYEGKMIHQFTHDWGKPKYWLDERAAAAVLLTGRSRSIGQFAKKHNIEDISYELIELDYKSYRIAFRDVAASTNERTMIMTVLPPKVFCPHTMSLELVYEPRIENGKLNPNHQLMTNPARLFLCAVMNSFIVDAWLRRSVTNHLSFFFIYGVPVPRLGQGDYYFDALAERAAKLICTTPEFDGLAREVGLKSHKEGATDEAERARLRAEIDGMVAHLYGLTEDEFSHILATFPLVAQSVKDAAIDAYRKFAPTELRKQSGRG